MVIDQYLAVSDILKWSYGWFRTTCEFKDIQLCAPHT